MLYILESRLGFLIGTLLFAGIAVAQFFCGMSSVTSNSRMIYAFSRDGAVPFHNVWHRLDRGRTPRNAIILAAVAAFRPGYPDCVQLHRVFRGDLHRDYWPLYRLWAANPAAPLCEELPARTVAPGRLEQANRHDRGDLGRAHLDPVHAATQLPRSIAGNFNYAPVAVLGTLLIVGIWWLVSARKWFKGPIIQGSEAELEAIEKSVGETILPEGVAGAGE